MTDLVVVGDANVDLVLRGDVVPRFGQAEQLLDSADFTLGGSGAIVACGVARLGYDVSLVAAVGRDVTGAIVRDELQAAGVSTGLMIERRFETTGISIILSGADRAILTHAGAVASLSAADVDATVLASARHVHSASPYLTPRLAPDLPRLLQTARDNGATVSIDTNDDPSRQWAGVADLLMAADIALPNENELVAWADALSGHRGIGWQEAAEIVATYVPQVVVKLGSAGGAVVSSRGALYQAAAAIEAVDTTGAGDSFDAGWIGGVLDGADPATALRWAVAAGGLSTRGPGGTSTQGDLADLRVAADALPLNPSVR